jgi:hypothetical protein
MKKVKKKSNTLLYALGGLILVVIIISILRGSGTQSLGKNSTLYGNGVFPYSMCDIKYPGSSSDEWYEGAADDLYNIRCCKQEIVQCEEGQCFEKQCKIFEVKQ